MKVFVWISISRSYPTYVFIQKSVAVSYVTNNIIFNTSLGSILKLCTYRTVFTQILSCKLYIYIYWIQSQYTTNMQSREYHLSRSNSISSISIDGTPSNLVVLFGSLALWLLLKPFNVTKERTVTRFPRDWLIRRNHNHKGNLTSAQAAIILESKRFWEM